MAQKADSPGAARPDSLAAATLRRDSVKTPRPAGAFLDDPITGKNTDSLVYDVRNKLVYIYNKGDDFTNDLIQTHRKSPNHKNRAK